MSNIDHSKLQALAIDLAKDIKTQDDLADLSSTLLKMTVEQLSVPRWRSI